MCVQGTDFPHKRRLAGRRMTFAAGLVLMLTACGSRLSGEYSDESGIFRYDFKSGGRVYMSTLGVQVAGEYKVDDNKVIIEGRNGNMVLDIREDGTLSGPLGMVLSKREEHR
jgi:hypothetical protein